MHHRLVTYLTRTASGVSAGRSVIQDLNVPAGLAFPPDQRVGGRERSLVDAT
ncbi:hypothetical protein GCM10011578_049860 [Streptomyces fuscichromogenes]|uniref:Uncharacterized protein n=1 Tax=Streptomyces fuscichromogenes TaxID=1324013 RepID=A0A917XFF2_9ACTN|nr:hypothetical protein GCM10011578_049860 [Streptomyces fuscichromogenes]